MQRAGSSASVRAALEDALECIEEGVSYCGQRTQASRVRALIQPGSFEELMVADLMEDGLGQTTCEVNEWRAGKVPPFT